jgi:hypothetical protein
LTLPELGKDTPERYAAALFVGDVVSAHSADAERANAIEVKLRTVGGGHKTVQVLLIERDGAAWSAPVAAGEAWSTVQVPLDKLRISRSMHIPSPYPGLWNYWRESPALRGGSGDHVRVADVERLQLTVFPNTGDYAGDDAKGAAIESIRLTFGN